MTTRVRYRLPEASIRAVEAKIGPRHPLVRAFRDRFHLEEATSQRVVRESVMHALEMIGSRHLNRMAEVADRQVQIRQAIHVVYAAVLDGHAAPADLAHLRQNYLALHETLREMADLRAGLAKDAEAVRNDPQSWQDPNRPAGADLQYPGGRPGTPEASSSPRLGQPIAGGHGAWQVRTLSRTDIRLRMDADGLYWHWPALEPGVVHHFPDLGYHVWLDPSTGAVVEEATVAASVTSVRPLTRGEEVMFSARSLGGLFGRHRMERAHGAGSPGGSGLDSPHGVAAAHPHINQQLENHGVEAWVRQLRDNAPAGVDYLLRTDTVSDRQMLTRRTYTISAVVEGRRIDLVTLGVEVRDPAAGIAGLEFDVLGMDGQAMADYGFPERVPGNPAGPSENLSRALDRATHSDPAAIHPRVAAVGTRIGDLAHSLHSALAERLARRADLRPEPGRRPTAEQTQAALDHWAPLQELDERLERISGELDRTSQVDADRMRRIERALAPVARTGSGRWAQRATAAQLRALARALDQALEQ